MCDTYALLYVNLCLLGLIPVPGYTRTVSEGRYSQVDTSWSVYIYCSFILRSTNITHKDPNHGDKDYDDEEVPMETMQIRHELVYVP